LLNSLQNSNGNGLVVEPNLAARLIQSLVEAAQRQEINGQPAVLLTAPQLRPWLAKMVKQGVPRLQVLAYNEISEDKQLKVVSSVGNSLASGGIENAA